MTVGELKELLDNYGDHLEVVIDMDHGDDSEHLSPILDVTDLSLSEGVQVRIQGTT